MKGVSVIIPAYNRESLIGATLESLLAQTFPASEIIVVDDGSSDGTADVARSFGSRVKVLQQKNKGPGAARNLGFKHSSGDFIHFFDSDDVAVPNKQEVQLAVLEKTRADIAYGPWIKGSFSGKNFCPVTKVMQQGGLPSGNLIKSLLCYWSIVPHACLFRRDIVAKVGGFPEDLYVGEDQLMFLNCLLNGAKVAHSPGTLELYRVENMDKITAAEEGHQRRLTEWARFLIKAHRICLSCNLNPVDWFHFRKRASRIRRELTELEFADKANLLKQLDGICPGKAGPIYGISDWLSTKKSGLRSRLMGHREHSSFRMGDLTDNQARLIRSAGYELSGKQSPSFR